MKNKQQEAVLKVAIAIYDALKTSPHGIPSGHLYAALMGKMTLEQFNLLIGFMVKNGMIKNTNHNLTAVVKIDHSNN